MKIKFVGNWNKNWQKQYNIPKGFIIIKPKEIYKKKIGTHLNKLDEFQEKKQELKDLDFTIEYHYRKRTLDQNNLMWALYTIEANEMNAGINLKNKTVTPDELYNNDLLDYGKKMKIQIKPEYINMIKSEYRVIDEIEKDGFIIITVILTTSKLNTKQMANWIDRIFIRMACNGVTVTNPAEIYDYWVKWKQSLNDNKIILHDDILTDEQYKALNPICEACGKYIGESGHLAHIKSRGSGGKDHILNYLYLCRKCHIETQHEKGWQYFLKIYTHLKYKVEMALKKEYSKDNIETIKNIFEGEINENKR
jgi:hypothetical protein